MIVVLRGKTVKADAGLSPESRDATNPPEHFQAVTKEPLNKSWIHILSPEFLISALLSN